MSSLGLPPVLAAGAVCWRVVDGKARVLLVHRDTHSDVSLPKGKLDPGETLPHTAVREIQEETGLSISLGAPLGDVRYTMPSGREKLVFYWAAEIDDHTLDLCSFQPNAEIAAIEWLSIGKARKRLSYSHDVDILDEFERRFTAGLVRTFALIVLRHAKTTPPERWDGPDSTRPLMATGIVQAQSVAPGIAAYNPRKIFASTASRCLATVEPLVALTGLKVKQKVALSQDAHEMGEADVWDFVAKRVARRETAVLCTHGPVLPDVIEEIARLTNTPVSAELRHAAMLSPGEYTAVHLSRANPEAGIIAIETTSPALY